MLFADILAFYNVELDFRLLCKLSFSCLISGAGAAFYILDCLISVAGHCFS